MLAFGSNEIELGKYTSNDCVVCAMANVGDGLFSESCFDCMVTWLRIKVSMCKVLFTNRILKREHLLLHGEHFAGIIFMIMLLLLLSLTKYQLFSTLLAYYMKCSITEYSLC